MRRTLALLLALTALSAGSAEAQAGCHFLCSPSFVAQPGIVVTNAIGAPEGASSHTAFNLRFTTVIPTAQPRLSLVALFQWTPAETGNAPGIAYGGVITLVRPQDTGGWLDVSFDPLGVFSPNASDRPGAKVYNHKLDLEGAAGLHLFHTLPSSNYLQGVTVYGLLDYLASGLPEGVDKWVILAGVTLPLAPWPH